MLFITPSKSAKHAKDYYTQHMERSDYYMKDAPEVPGLWHGHGAELLGLSGTVDKERYFQLCDNINPETGKRLTARTNTDRRILYDFTFDAPKSVTLAYELGGDKRILDEFRAALVDVMSDVEAQMMVRVRSNKQDSDRTTANMVWAEFIHRTTRPLDDGIPDPQLHCHAAVFNVSYDLDEKKWKAAQFGNIVRDKGHYQTLFHSYFAKRLENLGYGIERDGKGFRLAGIDAETTKKFSRRTQEIEAEAKRLGITDAQAKGELGARTRRKKDPTGPGLVRLREAWMTRLTETEREAIAKARDNRNSGTLDARGAMDYALSHCFERDSVVPEKHLLSTAMQMSVGKAAVHEVREQLQRAHILRQEKGGVRYVTTKGVLDEELAMSAYVRDGRGQHAKLAGIRPPVLEVGLSKEQRKASAVILGSRDRVTLLKGGAGTGKTRMMRATVNAIESSGKGVCTFAPTAEAAGVLRDEGFKSADTVARLLADRAMQTKVKNRVLWVDEAGLLSVKDMKAVFTIANEQNARLVLSGDTNQHNAVGRGDALRILERDAGIKTARLSEIRRQTNAQYRSAVKAISEGEVTGKDGKSRLMSGLEQLDKAGAIIEAPGENRYQRIAEDYSQITAQRKFGRAAKSALVISPTHREGERTTNAIREQLKRAGRLSWVDREFLSLRSLNLTDAQEADQAEYAPGAVIQFNQNARGFRRGERLMVTGKEKNDVLAIRDDGSVAAVPLHQPEKFGVYAPGRVALAKGDKLRITQNGFAEREGHRRALGTARKDRLNNGALYDVQGFTKAGDIKLTNGVVVPKNYGGITHGYVVTSHASQGKTVDVSLVALGHESLTAASREQLYVSASRGREAVRLYTDDKRAMMEAVQASRARMSATELIQPAVPKPRTNFVKRMIWTGVVQRAYSAVREHMSQYQAPARRQQQEGLSLG